MDTDWIIYVVFLIGPTIAWAAVVGKVYFSDASLRRADPPAPPPRDLDYERGFQDGVKHARREMRP